MRVYPSGQRKIKNNDNSVELHGGYPKI